MTSAVPVISREGGNPVTWLCSSFPRRRESSDFGCPRHSRESGDPVTFAVFVIPEKTGIQGLLLCSSFPRRRESSYLAVLANSCEGFHHSRRLVIQ